jgi:hypothetical protein
VGKGGGFNMKISVLVEPLPGTGFRVRGSGPFPFTAEGVTEEEALQNLHKLIADCVVAGGRVVELDVPPYKHPFEKFAGTLDPNDPIVQEWEEAMKEFRREMDRNPDLP